jgi:hypothetical protein
MIKAMFLVLIAATAGLTNSALEPQATGPHGSVLTLTGCVTSGDTAGSYKLTYSKRKDVTLTANENLKDKVGHEVRVTGKWEQEPTDSSKAAGTKTFKVENIQMLSDSCSLSQR